jgi:hypothetical protein
MATYLYIRRRRAGLHRPTRPPDILSARPRDDRRPHRPYQSLRLGRPGNAPRPPPALQHPTPCRRPHFPPRFTCSPSPRSAGTGPTPRFSASSKESAGGGLMSPSMFIILFDAAIQLVCKDPPHPRTGPQHLPPRCQGHDLPAGGASNRHRLAKPAPPPRSERLPTHC